MKGIDGRRPDWGVWTTSWRQEEPCFLRMCAVSIDFLSFAARVTPTLPKQARPVREGTRVASIETGLAAAAAKLAQQVGGGQGPGSSC